MRPFLTFFLGTPKRFLGTVGGLVIASFLAFPSLLRGSLERLAEFSALLFWPVVTLLITIFGFKLMFRGLTSTPASGKKKGRK